MKNTILFILALCISGAYAQNFPDPYCDITDPMIETEEITSVEFGDTLIVNENSTDVLVNQTSTVINIEKGQAYTLTVEGITFGDFDNDVYAFIDWNQNGILDDEGEVYTVGTITNSSGNDGISVSLEIIVPEDAVFGETRIRISKIYSDEFSPSIIDPCDIAMDAWGLGAYPGYGQALDFTLNIEGEDQGGDDEFPFPYCNITDPMIDVEEMTLVEFGDTVIVNENYADVLVDHTSTVVNIEKGQTYTLTVEGDTYGNFDNDVYAFIDWNQNGVLDDEGEVYNVGTITNSSGDDGISVSLEITVPEDAVLGETRIRVSKIYGDEESPSIDDPCDISMDAFGFGAFPGYGQAIDLTLNIEEEDQGGDDEFPFPYCDITDPQIDVEEITSVEFGDTAIVNENYTDVLVDYTSTVVNFEKGQTYTLIVEGNTYGNFDNDVYAFIDWNQNGVLDDAGEVYNVGTITNSSGEDGVSVSLEIAVPDDAVLGETRIRISKIYGDEDSPSIDDPCDISMDAFGFGAFPGFGQALDFTLSIGELSVDQFDESALSVYPIPTENFLNIHYNAELISVKIYNLLGQEVLTANPGNTEAQIDVSRLTEGTYLVNLLTENGNHNFKFIKR